MMMIISFNILPVKLSYFIWQINTKPPDLPLEKSVCRSGRTGHGITDSFKIRKGVHQGCIFNLNVEYIMRNLGLDEAQTGIKIAGRNINNLRYADDTTLMAESEEKLKQLLDESKRGEWKSWVKTQHSEN